MKKLLSMFMVIAVFFSVITVPVKAEPNTGSITISNPTVGEKYAIYQIFEASVKVVDGQADGIAYKMERKPANETLFVELFGADGTTENEFFQYRVDTKDVTVKDAAPAKILAYLKAVIAKVTDPNQVDKILEPIKEEIIASKDEVNEDGVVTKEGTLNDDGSITFTNVPYGYYFVTSSLGSVVSINSTNPDMTVIDKNQTPGEGFKKEVLVSEEVKDADGSVIKAEVWDDENTANIGDEIHFKVEFKATNYDGMKKIENYQILDEKGEGIWVEFNSFKVIVGGEELKRGYYVPVGNVDVLNKGVTWEYLGDWDTYTGEKNPDNAQWYLVHYGFDEFRILIPWLEGHDITLITNKVEVDKETIENHGAYTLTYDPNLEHDFLYESPSMVEVYYSAGIEYNASIGNGVTSKLFNTAQATWSFGSSSGSTTPDTTETKVYGIGITKVDAEDNNINLAGAQFKIYRKDGETKVPVYVIPTDVKGVYIVDSLNTFVGDNLSGYNRQPTRVVYKNYLAEYLGDDYETTKIQKNIVTSEVNGKFAILGLSEGTYFLEEIKAPDGYNAMKGSYEITITKDNSTSFSIFANEQGQVSSNAGQNAQYSEIRYSLVCDIIENGKGTTLPTTGAEGTIKMITIGTLITIAFGVLLITNKKMSVYRD